MKAHTWVCLRFSLLGVLIVYKVVKKISLLRKATTSLVPIAAQYLFFLQGSEHVSTQQKKFMEVFVPQSYSTRVLGEVSSSPESSYSISIFLYKLCSHVIPSTSQISSTWLKFIKKVVIEPGSLSVYGYCQCSTKYTALFSANLLLKYM